MLASPRPSLRPLLLGLAGLSGILALVVARLAPPRPETTAAPASLFSADRAFDALESWLGTSPPHPLGSQANAALVRALEDRLRFLGYQTEIQTAFTCNGGGVCGEVRNLLARRPGADPGPFVMLMSHSDSVGAGPGASDDGLGTAALLETARVLIAEAPGRNPVLLLVTDGEEAGLLGAQAFLDSHPLAGQVAVVVNLEARGTSGPSLLFETSGPGNAWLVRQATALPKPVTSSLFASVYDLLPNDTDLSVFKRRGVPGLNFAVVGEPRRYHTPLDDLAHLDRRSLQHHGDNLLALARRLVRADLSSTPAGRLAYFDLLGLIIARWPEAWQPWLAGLTLLALVSLAFWNRGHAPATQVLLALLCFLIAPLTAAAGALALTQLWQYARPGPRVWIAAGWAPMLAAFSSGLLGPALSALAFRRRLPAAARWLGSWLLWGLLALVSSRLLPGGAYLFLAPALSAAICGLVLGRTGPALARQATVLLPVFVAGLLSFPLAWLLYDTMGLPLTPATAAVLAMVVAPLATVLPPETSARRLLLPPLLGLTLGGTATAVLPPDSAERPQRMPFLYLEEAGLGEGRLLAVPESGRLPDSVRSAHSFGGGRVPALPWSRSARAFAAPVAAVALPSPQLTVQSDQADGDRRHLRLRLTSPRGAPSAVLAFPRPGPQIDSATVNHPGHPPVTLHDLFRRTSPLLLLATLPREGVEVDLILSRQSLEVVVADRSPGLPAMGQALLAARPTTAVTSQDGDATVVWKRVRL